MFVITTDLFLRRFLPPRPASGEGGGPVEGYYRALLWSLPPARALHGGQSRRLPSEVAGRINIVRIMPLASPIYTRKTDSTFCQ